MSFHDIESVPNLVDELSVEVARSVEHGKSCETSSESVARFGEDCQGILGTNEGNVSFTEKGKEGANDHERNKD